MIEQGAIFMFKQGAHRVLSILLVLALLMQMVPAKALAVTNETFITETAETAEPVTIVGEEESLRSETGKHFRMSDGSNIAVSYGIPVHYQDEDGIWQDIDNEPVRTYSARGTDYYTLTNDALTTAFSADLSESRLLTSVYDDLSVSVLLAQQGFDPDATAEVTAADVSALNVQGGEGWTAEDVIPEKLMSSMVYEEVFPDVDIAYTVCGFNVKEEIVVKKAQSAYTYDFLLELDGLSAFLNEDGSVALRNEDGEEIYLIPAPLMTDGDGNVSYDVAYTLEAADGGCLLSVTADAAWINAEDRAFPVRIDPSLTLSVKNANSSQKSNMYACYIQEGEPLYYGWSKLAYCGYGQSAKDKSIYVYMYVNNLPALPVGSIVTNAELGLYQYKYSNEGCSSMPIGLYEVTGENPRSDNSYYYWIYNFNWNTKPEFDRDNIIDYQALSSATTGKYVSWNMTELVKKWYAEKSDNRMIALAATQDGYSSTYAAWQVFYAYSDYNPPLFVVSYRSNTGVEPYYTYNTLGAGAAGTAYLADASGQLKVAKNLAGYASTTNPFSLNLTYNSDYFAYDNATDYQPLTTLGVKMTAGSGWTLDCVQKVVAETISGTKYLKYTDGDGTAHYFVRNTAMDSSGTYYFDEDGLGLKLKTTGTNDYEMSDDHGNRWIFTDYYLRSVVDSDGNAIQINYTSSRVTSITQKNSGSAEITVATFAYNSNTLTSVTDAAGNVYTLNYDGTKLVSVQMGETVLAQYAYDGYRLTQMTDAESGYTLAFAYEHGKVSHMQEQVGTQTGAQVGITYPNYSQTTYRDYGSDRTADTADDILTHYLFDYADRTVNAYTTDADGNILGASNAAYSGSGTTDKQNNRTLRSATIGKAGQQLLTDFGFESDEGWTYQGATRSEDRPRTGQYSVKGTQAGGYARKDSAALTAGSTYTLSAYINTQDITAVTGTGICLKVTDGNGNTYTSDAVNYTTSTAVDSGWVRVSVTFTAAVSDVHTVGVYHDGIVGTFYADDFQLELGDAPSGFNLVENGSMELTSESWTMNTGADITADGDVVYGTNALQISGNPESTATYAYQDVPVNLPGSKTYLLSGWVKANAVPDNVETADDPAQDLNKQCGLRAIVTYSDDSAEYHYVPFNPDLSTWQFVSYTLVPRETEKTVSTVRIVCAYEGNANIALFDNISLVRQIAQTMTYDADGNLVSSASTGLNEDTNTYENGNLIQTVTGGNGTYTYTYDTEYTHRLTEVSNGLIKQSYGYDGVGNATSTTLTDAEETLTVTSSATYTADGNRISSVTDAAGSTTSYNYTEGNSTVWGLPTSVTNAKGVTATTEYNNLGRVTETSIANTAHIQYDYDNGTVSSITRKDSQDIAQTYGFTYDAFGNTTSVKVGSVTLAAYTYAANNGLLQTQTYGNGDTVSYTYDDLGRAKTVTYADGRVVTYRYDGEGQLYSTTETGGSAPATYLYSYDSLGRLISSEMKNSSGTLLRTSQGYDANNRLLSQGWQMGSTAYSESYTYNEADGSLNAMTTGDGSTLTMGYDALRRLASINAGIYTASYTYRSLPNGNTTMQVAGLQYTGLADSLSFGYTYDEVGNLDSYTENGTTQTYTYDDQGQLTSATDGTTTYTYTYDTVGNILTASDGTGSHTYSYTNDQWRDLLTAFDGQPIAYQGQTYDAETGTVSGTPTSGNPTSYYNGTRWTFAWANGRQLTSATDGTKNISYTYNADGLRMTKTVDGVTHTYLYAGGKLLRETYGTTTLDFFYGSNGNPFALKHNNATYYYITNLQGDVLRLVDADGNTVASYTYDPYGNPLTATGTLANTNPLRYRGYYYDAETGFYYLQSRYYDPTICRFINADGYASTGQGIVGHNMFAYCGNKPIIFSDPSGEFGILTGLAIAGIVISAAIGGIVAGVGTAMSGGSVGEVILSSAIGAVTAGGIATAAALGVPVGVAVAASATMGAVGEISSIAVEHAFHKNDIGYTFNWKSAVIRTAYAAGISSLAGFASYGLNTTFRGADEMIGLCISAETSLALGLVDFSSRQVISSVTTLPKKKSTTTASPKVPIAITKRKLAVS